MELRISDANPAPASEQLRRQVLSRVREGELAPGTRLPTVRALAEELGVAVNTVARAYRLLEDDGIIEAFGRRGTFVANQGDIVQQQLQAAATAFARKAAGLGVSAADAEKTVITAIASQF